MRLVVTHWENKRDKAHSIKTDCEELLRKPIHTIVAKEQKLSYKLDWHLFYNVIYVEENLKIYTITNKIDH